MDVGRAYSVVHIKYEATKDRCDDGTTELACHQPNLMVVTCRLLSY